jgi:hypothetical protein
MDALFASVEQPDNIYVLQNKMILRAGNAGIDREILNELHAQRAWQRLLSLELAFERSFSKNSPVQDSDFRRVPVAR